MAVAWKSSCTAACEETRQTEFDVSTMAKDHFFITRGCSVVGKCVRFVVHTVAMKNINVFSM
jgi:hypothetical protein